MKKILPLFFISLFLCFIHTLDAQSVGDYRSAGSGNWSDVSTWQMFDGVNWIAAVVPPSPISGVITISDSVVVNDNDSADQLVVTSSGIVNILASASLKLLDGDGIDMQCDGKLIVGIGGALRTNSGAPATLNYSSSREFDIDGGVEPLVSFNGTAAQSIYGASGSGYMGTITLDNANDLTVKGTVGFGGVNFVNGKIFAPGYFVIGQYSGSNFTGQGPNSYIDGNISCIVYDNTAATFKLPTGSNGDYLPITFNVRTVASQETGFTVSIKSGAPPSLTLPNDLDKVSQVRYYKIYNPDGVQVYNSTSVQFSYDSTDGVTDPTNLRVAEQDPYSGTTWVNQEGQGTTAKAGTISIQTNFFVPGVFVLANATGGGNTLPLRIISFTAAFVKQAVQLNWTTTNEVNTHNFLIERKNINESTWQTIGNTPANAQSNANTYSYLDLTARANNTYLYRINEVDKDGSTYQSKILQVNTGMGGMAVNLVYPNPVKDVLHYYVSSQGGDAVTVAVITTLGKTLQLQKGTANQVLDVRVESLPAGTYLMTFTNARTGEKVVKKFIKQ
ncbi:MAG TPA: T9SS type A sorting domain-containing protein [Chitinophagaceae bacterium]|nr:T9SS type A sorting domain-containing protein [Chitinophagaceae bacterium]